MTIEYEQYQRLIFGLANRYQFMGIDKDELISIGNMTFLKCLNKYDKRKAKFSTYLTIKIQGEYWEAFRKKNELAKKQRRFESAIFNKTNPERIMIFREILETLSSDSTEIIKIVFNTPADLMNMLPKKQPRGINKTAIQKYLRKQGWIIPRIRRSFKEISEVLQIRI